MAIRVRRGSDADRLTVILEEGEVAFTTDTQMFYVGDNATLGDSSQLKQQGRRRNALRNEYMSRHPKW